MRYVRVFGARLVVPIAVGLFLLVAPVSFLRGAASAQTSQITLNVDAPSGAIVVTNGQRVLVGGWALAAGTSGTGITGVDVYLDGAPGTGAFLGSAVLGISRPDVASALGRPEARSSGYNFDWMPRNVSQGAHTLHVVARSSSGDSATQSVQVSGCGCGVNFQPTYAQPYVQRFGPNAWVIDTGGPSVRIERDVAPFFFW